MRDDISGSFRPNGMKFEHDRDKVLLLVFLIANLQNKGINSLFFTDKLHRTTELTLTSGCSDGQIGLPPVDRTSFPLPSERGGRVVQANVQNK